jgi:8-oxo-dGTP diphosphatase
MGSSDRQDSWPRVGASAVLFRGEEVLLVERSGGSNAGLWSLPGGAIEPGEPAEDAARREVLEETGLSADIVGLAGVYDVIDHDVDGTVVFHWVLATYYGRAEGAEPRAGSDARNARFAARTGLDEKAMTRGTRLVIDEAWRLLVASGV